MFTWIMENSGTIVVVLSIAVAVAAVVRGIARDRRNGKPACCNCGNGGGCCRAAQYTEITNFKSSN